ncbi:hypothetical protein [Microvirga calopogonii]|uniref:hypothetical protein n=1 Tax=Microvirga calopogonii TaxID=2078013 RepID=UPI000E0DB679|nr:hypothetical protein [Microvirga calopogonii]
MSLSSILRSMRRLITPVIPEQTASRPCSMVPVQVTLLTDQPGGARLITTPTSGLVVGIAPVTDAPILLTRTLFQRPLCYALFHRGALRELGIDGVDAPEARIGETMWPLRRFEEHFNAPPLPIEELLLVASRDEDGFGRDEIVALQEILTERAVRAGRYEVTGAPPTRSWLRQVQPQLVEHWLADLRPMLISAGCDMFEPRRAVLVPRHMARPIPAHEPIPQAQAALPPLPSGFTVDVPEDLLSHPEARRYRLTFNGASAQARVIGPWTVLEKGSFVAGEDRLGIQPCLANKRRLMQERGVLRPAARQGLLRVTRHVALPSLTNAGRVVTGGNGPKDLWDAA